MTRAGRGAPDLLIDEEPNFVRQKIPWFARFARSLSSALILSPIVLLSPTPVRADTIVVTRAILATTIIEFCLEADPLPVEPEISAAGFDARCKWNVAGSV